MELNFPGDTLEEQLHQATRFQALLDDPQTQGIAVKFLQEQGISEDPTADIVDLKDEVRACIAAFESKLGGK
jgi:exoribonuclease II